MDSETVISRLQKENETLQFELNDLEYLISLREEELQQLKNKAAAISELQSRYDRQLYQIEQMQLFVLEERKKAAGAVKRENALEEELIQGITIEKEYYSLKEQHNSTLIALEDTGNQLADAVSLYKKLKDMKSRIAELESNLEIAMLDNQFLKEEIEQLRSEKNIDLSTL